MNNDQYHNGVPLITKAQGAFLGAAVGDALGWSQEFPSKRLDKQANSQNEELTTEFQQWIRRSGGRYFPHEELILAGEYSDDTQLFLCTARSLLCGKQWWHHFTKQEIPTWKCYERGGGRATKRAVNDWLAGVKPWSSSKNKKGYFEAGGNGVAMRILPHSLLGAKDPDFSKVAQEIVANGVCTHGHPRALVGALAYGFAVWVALRESGTLTYGAIIEKVLSEVHCWSELPEFEFGDIYKTWRNSAKELNAGQYKKRWRETVEEMRKLLEQCQEAMKQGALSVDQEVLEKLGCFGKSKSSGNISAAASIFLASRYAADPKNGLVVAAFAQGADTDTIASMTGGLLGSIAGIEWLGDYAEQVQDSRYISNLAEQLARNESRNQDEFASVVQVTKAHIDDLIKTLETLETNASVQLPDGRQAKLSASTQYPPLSKATRAVYWKLVTLDAQILYVRKLSHIRTTQDSQTKISEKDIYPLDTEINFQPVDVVNTAVQLNVHDLKISRFFYEKILGLKAAKESGNFVRYGGIILGQLGSPNSLPESVYIEVKSLEAAYNNVLKFGAKDLSQVSEKLGRRFFRCLDPDGNRVEVFEVGF